MDAKSFLKLGTSIRYLIDIRQGEPIHGKYILSNIDIILKLIKELGFSNTESASSIQQLKTIKESIKRYGENNLNIGCEDANELNKVCRRIRDSLFVEGTGMTLNGHNDFKAPKINVEWLIKNLPYKIWITGLTSLCGIISVAFSIGSKFASIGIL